MGQVEKLKKLCRFPSLILFWKPKVHPFDKKKSLELIKKLGKEICCS